MKTSQPETRPVTGDTWRDKWLSIEIPHACFKKPNYNHLASKLKISYRWSCY